MGRKGKGRGREKRVAPPPQLGSLDPPVGQFTGSNLTAGRLQATLSKLLTYCELRSTQPPTLREAGNEEYLTGYAVKA